MSFSRLPYFVARGEVLRLDRDARLHLRGSFAPLSAGVTHYELTGPANGELVLLVPGLTIPLFYWDGFVKELHKMGFRTLAYSAYGRGFSDRVVATYDQGFMIQQARELLEYLDIKRIAHLMGTSMGALISMALLQEKWFSAKTLTLIGPAGLESQLPLNARLARLDGVGKFVGKYFGQRGVVGHLHHNVRTAEQARQLKAMVGEAFRYEGSIYALFSTLRSFPLINRHHLYKMTGHLGVPVLLAWGAEDRVTPVSSMTSVKDMIRPIECHVISQCGHMAPFERPDQVAMLFRSFLARLHREKFSACHSRVS